MTIANCIIHGDAIATLQELPEASIDAAITDPPYGVGYRDRYGRSVANDSNLSAVLPAFAALYRTLKPDSFCVSFYG